MAFTLDQIKQYAANPSTIPTGGSYGEGAAYNLAAMFPVLKQAVQNGQLTLVDYQGLMEPLAKAAQGLSRIAGQGSKQANAVNGALAQMQDYVDFGKGTGKMPFSRQEYAKLPDSVLPTQNDINTGMFDPTGAPIQRVQTPQAPSQPSTPANPQPQPNPGPGNTAPGSQPNQTTAGNNPQTQPATSTPNNQVQGAPQYSANPNNIPPMGGLTSTQTDASNDAQRIAQEAALQQQLSTQTQQGITDARKKYISDLTDLMNQNVNQQMSEQLPGIYEDLNTRGLLRSSALGNSLATTRGNLIKDNTLNLEKTALDNENADLNNYNTIQNNYNAGRNSALSREFSVEDYQRQIDASKMLGDEAAKLKPQAPSTKQQVEVAAAGSAAQGAASGATKAAMA